MWGRNGEEGGNLFVSVVIGVWVDVILSCVVMTCCENGNSRVYNRVFCSGGCAV